MASATRNYDCLIFGGGLAGSLLGYTLLKKGHRPLVIDSRALSTCSRVAAGLINPIGGKRLNPIWNADALIPFARNFYRDLASSLGQTFYHPRPVARLLSSEEEQSTWKRRSADPRFRKWTQPLEAIDLPMPFANKGHRGFSIRDAGYLDTPTVLNSIRKALESAHSWLDETFHYTEIESKANAVEWRSRAAPYAIFCDGHLASQNPWFSFARYKPAKGVIGRISTEVDFGRVAILEEKFLIPRHDQSIHVGATYDWESREDHPDPIGIQELEAFLDRHLGNQWKWKSVEAGVRPATAGAKPIIGPCPQNSRILSFNGFGSKGAVQIPYFANALRSFLFESGSLPAEILPNRFEKKECSQPRRWVAVEIARDRVLQHIEPGQWTVDATAGNGHDSLWLAQKTGPSGRVFAFDIQRQAIDATEKRLQRAGCLDQVTLIQDSHARMLERIPTGRPVSAVVFNLGYLPGSDKSFITRTESTLSALNQSLEMLSNSGILSVVLYPGHQGGRDESEAVVNWARSLDSDRFSSEFERHPTIEASAPFVLFVTRRPSLL